VKKGFDRAVDRSVEWQFCLCLQQKCDKGGGGGRKSYQVSNKTTLVFGVNDVTIVGKTDIAPKLELMIQPDVTSIRARADDAEDRV